MDRKVAKELLHVRDWLDRTQDVVARGQEAYTTDELLQEAGDSLMMKLGEAAGRLARANVEPPPGVAWTDAIANRNWLIHQYDEIDRALTWVTLSRDLTSWRVALTEMFIEAQTSLALPGANDGNR
jgi:uncharacterized protein with HEPN domain